MGEQSFEKILIILQFLVDFKCLDSITLTYAFLLHLRFFTKNQLDFDKEDS